MGKPAPSQERVGGMILRYLATAIPAKAGTRSPRFSRLPWFPAFAGKARSDALAKLLAASMEADHPPNSPPIPQSPFLCPATPYALDSRAGVIAARSRA
jgi:hypothetical protein